MFYLFCDLEGMLSMIGGHLGRILHLALSRDMVFGLIVLSSSVLTELLLRLTQSYGEKCIYCALCPTYIYRGQL